MSLSEYPHSVESSIKKTSDANLLALRVGNLKIVENEGKRVKKSSNPMERLLLLRNFESEKGNTSIIFQPGEETDKVFFSTDCDNKKTEVARNGTYVEIGIHNKSGHAKAQFDIKTGNLILASADIESFSFFNTSPTISPDSIRIIEETCNSFRKNSSTPQPKLLAKLYELSNSVVQTSKSEISHQLELPLS